MLKLHLNTPTDVELNRPPVSMEGTGIEGYHMPPSTSVTDTTELYSSTFAVLTDTPEYQGDWQNGQPVPPGYYPDQGMNGQPGFNDMYDNGMRYDYYRQYPYFQAGVHPATTPVQYPHYQSYPQQSQYHVPQNQKMMVRNQQPFYPPQASQYPTTSRPQMMPPRYPNGTTVSPREDGSINSPALTSSGSTASGPTPPLSSEVVSTDLEGADEEQVMCMACRGVYPSRRSLTGHIGRNEKCREFIESSGRSYLEQMEPPEILNEDGTIRKHLNPAFKAHEVSKKPKSEKGRKRKNDMIMAINGQMYENSMYPNPNLPAAYYNAQSSELCSPSNDFSEVYVKPFQKRPEVKRPENGSPPEDAYICQECDFVTVYKGNMKRHLNTCHPPLECKNLKEWDMKLESMRASSLGIYGKDLEKKLSTHKQNSSRGRKPKKKKTDVPTEDLDDKSEAMTDYEPNNEVTETPKFLTSYTE